MQGKACLVQAWQARLEEKFSVDAIEEFVNGDGPSEYVKVCKVANEAEIWSLQSPNKHSRHFYTCTLSYSSC
jgi:hypothetical protein